MDKESEKKTCNFFFLLCSFGGPKVAMETILASEIHHVGIKCVCNQDLILVILNLALKGRLGRNTCCTLKTYYCMFFSRIPHRYVNIQILVISPSLVLLKEL